MIDLLIEGGLLAALGGVVGFIVGSTCSGTRPRQLFHPIAQRDASIDDVVRDIARTAPHLAVALNLACSYEMAHGDWVTWKGGDTPVKSNDFVWVKHRNGEVKIPMPAREKRWSHTGDVNDIIAYRMFP